MANRKGGLARKCENCGLESEGKHYSFSYGQFMGSGVSCGSSPGSYLRTTRYLMRGEYDVFLCERCVWYETVKKIALYLILAGISFYAALCFFDCRLWGDLQVIIGIIFGLVTFLSIIELRYELRHREFGNKLAIKIKKKSLKVAYPFPFLSFFTPSQAKRLEHSKQ